MKDKIIKKVLLQGVLKDDLYQLVLPSSKTTTHVSVKNFVSSSFSDVPRCSFVSSSSVRDKNLPGMAKIPVVPMGTLT